MADAAPEAPSAAPEASSIPSSSAPAAPAPEPVQPAVTPAAAPPKAPDASRLLAEATRRERAIRAEKEAWKSQRAKEESAWKERVSRAETVEAMLAAAKKTPLKALEAMGLTYEELSMAQLNDGKPSADLAARVAEERVAALEKRIEDDKKAAEQKASEANKVREQQLVATWHSNVQKQVASAGEKYEMINALGYAAEVGKMVEEHYDSTGEEVPWTVAAERLEKYLQEEQDPAVKGVWDKVTGTKWFQSRYAPVVRTQEAPPPRRSRDMDVPERKSPPPEAPAPAAPTITNKMPAYAGSPKTPAAKSRAELRAQAFKVLNDTKE